ncbi:hypothetical protein Bca52824_033615 [Brassica carinata]|uniref:Retrotransposon gag domain-containing protein n=1 Tax=Brassica carinata TaxID=52824 RepID=A0A8X7V786_BRACI|nr:hypothetical protein Bca52824_033615 [Brassica carinata]
MMETRSQTLSKTAAARDVDGTSESHFEANEKALELQNERTSQIEEIVREMMEDFKVMMNRNPLNASTSCTALERDDVQGVAENNINHLHQQGPHRNHNNMTRLGKIDFPRFDGTKVKEWFPKVEQFFLIDETPEESKVSIASMHFDGEASAWHQALVQEDEGALILRNWRVYRNRLKERFEEVLDDPIAELKKLKKK